MRIIPSEEPKGTEASGDSETTRDDQKWPCCASETILCGKMMETQNYWEDSSAHSMQVKYERYVFKQLLIVAGDHLSLHREKVKRNFFNN